LALKQDIHHADPENAPMGFADVVLEGLGSARTSESLIGQRLLESIAGIS
jgi:hypothetical protein